MKKKIILAVLALAGPVMSKAQDAKSVFSANEIVWFGLDFSKAKFVGAFTQIGDAGSVTGSDLKNKWIPAWNALVINEPQNFDFKKSFRKDNLLNDITSVTEINKKVDPDAMMSNNPGKIERSDIDAMVKNYKADVKTEGIGLVFIVENFNKTTATGDVWVTLFDIASKKVLITEKMSAKAGGAGMKNYWAKVFKLILKQIDEGEYKSWKSKYSK
ncbi:MAG: hypothetical protein ACJ77K_01485 [Bacteroidia bacterium]